MSAPIVAIDVRPLLRQGVDPLEKVIELAQSVDLGGRMEIDAPFDPVPLRQILSQMGFSSRVEAMADHHWRISMLRDGQGNLAVSAVDAPVCKGLPDPGAPVRRDQDGLHIDVRGLAAPLPMLAILRLVSAVEPAERIIVHHDRDPVFLYPELAELGWQADTVPGDPGEVRLSITRTP